MVLELESSDICAIDFSGLDNTLLVWKDDFFQVWDASNGSITLSIRYPEHSGRRKIDLVRVWKNLVATHFENHGTVVWDVVTGASVLQVQTSGKLAYWDSIFLRAGVLAAVLKKTTNSEGSDNEDEAPLTLTLWEMDGGPAVLSQPDPSPKPLRGPLVCGISWNIAYIATDLTTAGSWRRGRLS